MREVAEDVFALEAAGRASNAFLVRREAPVLVDAGTPRAGPRIAAELAAAGIRPALVLLTHGDFDHVGGAEAIRRTTGAGVCAPAAERGLLSGETSRGLLVRTLVRLATLGRGLAPQSVDRWLEAGEVVEGLEVVPAPGHTPGHACYLLGRTLFAGDALITGDVFRESVGLFIADRAEARRSIERLARLDVDLAVSGHGPPARDAAAKLRALAATWS